MIFFKSIAVLQDFSFLQYCNTPILDLKKYCNSNAILKKSIAILHCNTAILHYWGSGSYIHKFYLCYILLYTILNRFFKSYVYIRLSLIVSPRSGEMRFSRFSLVWQYLYKFGSHFKNLWPLRSTKSIKFFISGVTWFA